VVSVTDPHVRILGFLDRLHTQNKTQTKHLTISAFINFVHRPEFRIVRKYNVSETGSVSIFRLEERDAYSVGSLRNGLTPITGSKGFNVSLPHLKRETDPFSETLCFLVIYNYG
jgi:hypothetical protein